MKILRFLNRPNKSNSYIITDNDKESSIIIDPGDVHSKKLISFHKKNNIKPYAILLTHGHFDHFAGVKALLNEFTTPVYASKNADILLRDSSKNFSKKYLNLDLEFHDSIPYEENNNVINWEKRIEIYNTPGHTKGSVCIKIENSLFTGDTLINNIAVYSEPSLYDDLMKSFDFIRHNFSGDTKIYPGHGNWFYLKNTNWDKVIPVYR